MRGEKEMGEKAEGHAKSEKKIKLHLGGTPHANPPGSVTPKIPTEYGADEKSETWA